MAAAPCSAAMTTGIAEPIDGATGKLDAFDPLARAPLSAAPVCQELEDATSAGFGLWPFVELLRRNDVSIERLCELTGLELELLREPEVRFSQTVVNRVVELAYERVGSDAGLAAALTVEAGHYHLLELILRTAPRVVDGLIQGCRFFPLLSSGGQLVLEPAADGALCLRWQAPASCDVHRGCVELSFGVLMLGMRRETGRTSIMPAEVWFTHQSPTNLRLHERVLGRNVRFGMPDCHMLFDRRVANLPLTRKNPEVHAAAIRTAADSIDD